ncbi:GNAT family N-acetyltransferase [Ilyobacter polytropus]|uniref:N-acetyltransferase domain-containing protein n=1 Tax=Ilyobacter polytropus (strain ATCC 51220 / DSM 2926 / LMG 16218 / CuHBu1) TaxID=572544 RepID=E3HB66_ILYPC|nr:GNAT family N-acetyltransferase [Ilyobacter polytropus]ADO82217.1 conserved hypothetical protein [Ilyobacter polytropus DSM 2926]
MEINWIEWFGYISSFVVLISLTMSSIIKLRWINLIGAIMFSIFGFMINSYPTGTLNLGIAFIDLYYLYKIYMRKEEFSMVKANFDSDYFKYFINFNRKEIDEQYNTLSETSDYKAYYYLRNNNISGVMIGRALDNDTFFIELDYVTKEFRDFKIGKYFLGENRIKLLLKGYSILKARANSKHHAQYLEKIGFKKVGDDTNEYIKTI